jgi:hypothetical protein
MTLGETLVQLAKLHPHYFNSFYRRVRIVREAPRPMPAAATVDVTHRCALQCPFCIAADVLDQRDMSTAAFDQVCKQLSGIGRLTLMGGEPFQHPNFETLVTKARDSAAEVEVFTNGLALGTSPERAPERLTKRIPDASKDWLTLVLSVDPGHASQMTPGRLQSVVNGVLLAASKGLCKARFSVTHPALATGIYLDTDTVTTAIAEVAPKLAHHFMERLEQGEVQDSYYFNSVICALPPAEDLRQDSTLPTAPGPEVLRLEDLVWSPEIAISFDRDGQPEVFTSLASMWSNRPPPHTRLGKLKDGSPTLMTCSLEDSEPLATLATDSDGPMPPGTHPGWAAAWSNALTEIERFELLRSWLPFHSILTWDGGLRLTRARAHRLARFVQEGLGDRVLRYGGDEGEGRLDGLEFRQLLHHLTDSRAELADLAEGTAASLAALFGTPLSYAAPVYAGARELLGKRVPQAPGERHALVRVHLPQEPGFTNRDELVVRPLLELFPGGRSRILFPGILAGDDPSPAALATALNRLLEMVTCLGGQRLCRAVVEHLPSTLADSVLAIPNERLPDPAAEDDLLAAFVECSFDRNRQRPDEENGEFLTLLLAHASEHFPKAALRTFTSRAITWLERLHRQHKLSHNARARLASLTWKGREAKRVALLVGR